MCSEMGWAAGAELHKFLLQAPVALVINDNNLRKPPMQKTFCGLNAATEQKENVYLMTKLACPQICHFVFINFGKNPENVAKGNHCILKNWKQSTGRKLNEDSLKVFIQCTQCLVGKHMLQLPQLYLIRPWPWDIRCRENLTYTLSILFQLTYLYQSLVMGFSCYK